MLSIINVLFFVFIAIAVISLIAYLPKIRAWFAGFTKQPELLNNKLNRFALIIPARDESCVIHCLFESILKQTYEKRLFDSHILVKNENDKTIELSKSVNGIIHIIREKKCKGYDINIALQEILKENPNKYDAYIIVDADCCLDKNFLKEMNNAMASGKQIIQAKKLVKNKLYKDRKVNNWVTNCNGLIWTMIDELGNKYKSDKNITAMTIGTGILLRSDVIKQLNGWPYVKTLTEDIELMYDCVCKNFSTFYYRPAKIYVEESTSLTETNKRRKRWISGVIASKKLYNQKIKTLKKTKSVKKNIYYVNALIPVYWFIGSSFLGTLYFLISGLLFLIFHNSLWSTCLNYSFICFLFIYFSFLTLTIFCLLVDRKNNKLNFGEVLSVLILHPFFYMKYIEIVGKSLFNQQEKEWKIIKRMKMEEVNEKNY